MIIFSLALFCKLQFICCIFLVPKEEYCPLSLPVPNFVQNVLVLLCKAVVGFSGDYSDVSDFG